MGFGDDIMAAGFARDVLAAAKEKNPNLTELKAVFGNPDNFHDPVTNHLQVYWSEVFEANPRLLPPGGEGRELVCVPHHPGNRPYIDYAKCEFSERGGITRFAFNPEHNAPRGEIFFTNGEILGADKLAEEMVNAPVFVEPHVKRDYSHGNKGWPWENWQQLVNRLRTEGVSIYQMAPAGARRLTQAHFIQTENFRSACAVLARAWRKRNAIFVGCEGALHHLAAAQGVPAVVLWGHYSSPEILGYDLHTNLRAGEGTGCGTLFRECAECVEAMHSIDVGIVADLVLHQRSVALSDEERKAG